MRMTPWQKRMVAAVIAIATLSLIAGEVAARRTPAGCYRSYRLTLHDPTDALHLTNGAVRWFACGTTDEGTYHKTAEGTWMWDWPTKRYTNRVILRPHLFWLTCIDAARPTNVYRLRRAFTVPKGGGHE